MTAILEVTNRIPGITRALLLYRLVQLAFSPFIFLYFGVRLLATPAYRRHFRERLGFLPRRFSRTNPGCIWLHAVSAGEVASALPLIEELRADRPLVPIYLSTSTVAGRAAAERRASSLVSGVFYCPIDYAFFVRCIIRAIRPALLVVAETEIWPNLYVEIKRSGAQLAIVNGRISNRAWPRYRAFRTFFAPILQLPDLVFAQSRLDHDRYELLGVPKLRIEEAGNLKYDALLVLSEIGISTFDADHVWIAASTAGPNESGSSVRHSIDEDEIVIQTFKALTQQFPRLLLILAPRQPTRFDAVARKLANSGVRYVRRTDINADPSLGLQLPGVLLLDTIGELAGIFPLANVVFVGGSIAPRGGHSLIEPANFGLPIVVGTHMENFESITRDFLAAQAIVQISGEEELLPAIRGLLADPARAKELGHRAREVVHGNQGVARRVADRLWPLCYGAFLKRSRGVFARSMLSALAGLWCSGGKLKRRHSEGRAATQVHLPVPVISVGGITVGGSGKTPFTNYLASRLSDRGCRPAILTRGYGRQSPAQSLVFAPGARVPPALTGDEAQIFLRTGVAPLGIGTDRYACAKVLLSEFPTTNVLLLDDGFQHFRLQRDFDVVVMDGLDPFGEEEPVPLGRLRESLQALQRAHAFVVTRVEDKLRYQAICARLRDYNPKAAIFRTRLVARHWCDYGTGECTRDLPVRKVGAFCGIGNPQNFWNSLDSLGLETVFRWTFEDHHRYKPVELQRIAHQAFLHGAEILVTTEKDRLNCPSNLDRAIAPLDLAWLEIDLEIEEEAAFFELLDAIVTVSTV